MRKLLLALTLFAAACAGVPRPDPAARLDAVAPDYVRLILGVG